MGDLSITCYNTILIFNEHLCSILDAKVPNVNLTVLRCNPFWRHRNGKLKIYLMGYIYSKLKANTWQRYFQYPVLISSTRYLRWIYGPFYIEMVVEAIFKILIVQGSDWDGWEDNSWPPYCNRHCTLDPLICRGLRVWLYVRGLTTYSGALHAYENVRQL